MIIRQWLRFLVFISLLSCCLQMASRSFAGETFYVPDEYPTIQSAIDAASPYPTGEQIVVSPGTYHEAIDFKGRYVALRSTDGAAVTIIDALGLGAPVVTCAQRETYHVVIDGFTIRNGYSLQGSGFYLFDSSPTIKNCMIENNSTFGFEGGAGLCALGTSSPYVRDCVFTNNYGTRPGGAILVDYSTSLFMSRTTFDGNESEESGGAIQNYGTLSLVDCAFVNNQAIEPYWDGGGAIQNHGFLLAEKCSFVNNAVLRGDNGGAISTSNTTILNECSFDSNEASVGGAIAVGGSSMVDVRDCIIVRNRAYNGSAVYIEESPTFTLDGCVIEANEADSRYDTGSAVYAYQSGGETMISNTSFRRNIGINGDGGGLASWLSDTTIINCEFINEGHGLELGEGFEREFVIEVVNCTIQGCDVGVSVWDGEPELVNCVIADSTTASIEVDDDASIIVTYSNIEGGFSGEGNIDADPMLVDRAIGDLRLLAGSPCIDAGNNSRVPIEFMTDLGGDPRFHDDLVILDTGKGTSPIVDMGAFEFQDHSGPYVVADPDPLIAGLPATIRFGNANPNARSFLAYSVRGLGETFVRDLNITLDLKRPRQVGGSKRADSEGSVEWTLPVPSKFVGISLWFQGAQYETKTIVLETMIVE